MAAERRAARIGVVLADGVVGLGRRVARREAHRAGELGGVQAGRENQLLGRYGRWCLARGDDLEEPIGAARDALDGRIQNDVAAARFDMAFEREHIGVRVDRARRG